jgi:WXG100 family type VII secretion target
MADIRVTPGDLDKFSSTCTTEAGNVGHVKTTVRRALDGTDWDSPAAKRFRDDWATKYEKSLNDLDHALRELSQAAKTMATNYRSTEDAYKG